MELNIATRNCSKRRRIVDAALDRPFGSVWDDTTATCQGIGFRCDEADHRTPRDFGQGRRLELREDLDSCGLYIHDVWPRRCSRHGFQSELSPGGLGVDVSRSLKQVSEKGFGIRKHFGLMRIVFLYNIAGFRDSKKCQHRKEHRYPACKGEWKSARSKSGPDACERSEPDTRGIVAHQNLGAQRTGSVSASNEEQRE